jgi:hypothetical protein
MVVQLEQVKIEEQKLDKKICLQSATVHWEISKTHCNNFFANISATN